jgi:hypothetical protein
MPVHIGPSDVHEPERRGPGGALGRIGRGLLILGSVLAYWILLAAPWSDKQKAQAALLALVVAGIGALIGTLSVPSDNE